MPTHVYCNTTYLQASDTLQQYLLRITAGGPLLDAVGYELFFFFLKPVVPGGILRRGLFGFFARVTYSKTGTCISYRRMDASRGDDAAKEHVPSVKEVKHSHKSSDIVITNSCTD